MEIRNCKSRSDKLKSPCVIGLTGGIASGKSTVARLFERLGAAVIDADAIAKETLRTPEISGAIRREWGETVFGADGFSDRAKIAALVFGDAEKLKKLIAWMHPPILREMRVQLDRALANPGVPLIVIDAPLLMEGETHTWCDALLFVEAGDQTRARRAASVRGWEKDELARREARQMPLEEKRRRADAVVRNDAEESETFEQVQSLFQKWKRQ